MSVEQITPVIVGSLTKVPTGTGKLTQAAQTAVEKGGQELEKALYCLAGANKASIYTGKLPSGYSEFVDNTIKEGVSFQQTIKEAKKFYGMDKKGNLVDLALSSKSIEEMGLLTTDARTKVDLLRGIFKAIENEPEKTTKILKETLPKGKGFAQMTLKELLEVLNSVFIYIPRQS